MNNLHKAKIFLFLDQWQECCIGYVQIVHTNDDNVIFIRCILESQNTLCSYLVQFIHFNSNKQEWCLNFKVNPEILYQFKGENIISWQEGEINLDIAINFIDSKYAYEIWDQLQNSKTHQDGVESAYQIQSSQLILEAIISEFSEKPELIIEKITNDTRNLLMDAIKQTFEDAEMEKNYHILDQLHCLIRSLIYMKNENVLKTLLSDKYYMTFFGIMEYNFLNKGSKRISYRQFLRNELKYHQIIEFENSIIEKIHFNYRLSYLKESVMAYCLYVEDSLYNEFNMYICENNQKILESLLITQKNQFKRFLESENFEVKCKFINEFYLQFKIYLANKQLNDAFLESVTESNFLQILYQNSLLKVQQKSQSQICFTTLQITLMIANSNPSYLFDFLKNNQQLFWQCMEALLFCEMNDLSSILIDIIQIITSNPLIQSQCIEWLKKCFQQPLNFSAAALVLQELVQWICEQQQTMCQDLIVLSNYILDILCQQQRKQIKDKFLLMSGLKHFKYISTTGKCEILKPYCNSLVQLGISKRIDGVLEGQIKDILRCIIVDKNLSQHLILIIRTLNLQNHQFYSRLFKHFQREELGQMNEQRCQGYEYEYDRESFILFGKENLKVNADVQQREIDEDSETSVIYQGELEMSFGEKSFKRIKI